MIVSATIVAIAAASVVISSIVVTATSGSNVDKKRDGKPGKSCRKRRGIEPGAKIVDDKDESEWFVRMLRHA